MSHCFSPTEIEQFLAGELGECSTSAVRSHLADCEPCRMVAGDIQLFDELRQACAEDRLGPQLPLAEPSGPNDILADGEAPAGYEIVRELHRGGQGVVYQAVQIATKRPVALKVLLRGKHASEQQRLRFEREINLAAGLRHPNIVTIYDSGSIDGRQFLAMEYLDGRPLDDFLVERGARSTGDTRSSATRQAIRADLQLFHKVCCAVAYAQMRGVVHRDLKPRNILVDRDGEPHILDFGLAKLTTSEPNSAVGTPTLSGEFIGTLAYASPEQTKGDARLIDIRTDVYSLGVILFEMLTGTHPYDLSGPLSRTLANICEVDPQSPSSLRHGMDDELDTIVLKALAKDPDRRYQSAEQFAADIAHYLAGEPIDAKRDSTWYLARKLISRNRTAVSSAAAVIVLIAIALVVSLASLRQAVLDRDAAIQSGIEADQAKVREAEQRQEAERLRDEAEYQSYVANIAAAGGALQSLDVEDARMRLNRAPPNKRNWEWWHLHDQLDSSAKILLGHGEYIEGIACFRRRPWIASVSWDQSVRLWNRESGEQLFGFSLPTHGWSIALSPDEKMLAVGDWNGVVRCWSMPDGQKLFQMTGPTQRVVSLAFRPGHRQLAAAFWAFNEPQAENVVWIIDLDTREKNHELPIDDPPSLVRFLPSGERLIVSTAKESFLWDAEFRERLAVFPGHKGLAVSPDGNRLACADSKYIVSLHDLNQNELVREFRGHTGDVQAAAFSADGKQLATVSRDKTVRVWDTKDESPPRVFLGHTWAVTSVGFAKKGRHVVTGSWDGSIRVWDTDGPQAVRLARAHREAVSSVVFFPDGTTFATASHDHDIVLWDTETRSPIRTLSGHTAPVQGIAISPDGTTLASASWDKSVRIWNLSDDLPPICLDGHSDRVHSVAFHPRSGQLVSGSRDNTLRVWDMSGENPPLCVAVLQGHNDHVHSVCFDRDGTRLASSGHKTVRIWDASDWHQVHSLSRNIIQEDYSLAFHPKGNELAAGHQVTSLGFWNPATGRLVASMPGHSDEILSVAYNQDGSRLVSASVDGAVKLWDIRHHQTITTLHGHGDRIRCIAFSPDGRLLVGGQQDGQLIFWDSPQDSTVP